MSVERTGRGALQRTVLAVLVPLALVVLAGIGVELWMARAVHTDVVRLFEELREVSLARTLVDELRGVESWVEALPAATADSHPDVFADVHRHHEAARQTLARFVRAEDPSRDEHTDDEQRLFEQLAAQLAELGRALGAGAPLGRMREPLEAAVHAAQAVSHAVDAESREIGNALDQRSGVMVQVLLLLGMLSVAAVGGLGVMLLRRVLRPVGALHDAAVRFGRGERDLTLPSGGRDELGDLARAFAAMAEQLRENQRDLEQRVEARSREVLRSAKLAQLGTLAAGIAHEINNPLASIVACSEGLLRDVREGSIEPEPLREYLEILRKEAMRARDITTKLLRFARQDPARREVVALRDQVREVAALFAHQLADAGVELRLDDSGLAGGCEVLADAAELRQVLFNLLRNALDASPRGACITLRCARVRGDVELGVEDQGPGIPEALRERVFEPFFTTKGPGNGTGLGLAIVHRIVSAHGGRVRIEDAHPGTRFVLSLPAADGSPTG